MYQSGTVHVLHVRTSRCTSTTVCLIPVQTRILPRTFQYLTVPDRYYLVPPFPSVSCASHLLPPHYASDCWFSLYHLSQYLPPTVNPLLLFVVPVVHGTTIAKGSPEKVVLHFCLFQQNNMTSIAVCCCFINLPTLLTFVTSIAGFCGHPRYGLF